MKITMDYFSLVTPALLPEYVDEQTYLLVLFSGLYVHSLRKKAHVALTPKVYLLCKSCTVYLCG